MKLMEPYRTSPELKAAYNTVIELIEEYISTKDLFFQMWATAPNQQSALRDQKIIDNWLSIVSEHGIIAVERMDSLIEQEIEEYPFRANCWRYEI